MGRSPSGRKSREFRNKVGYCQNDHLCSRHDSFAVPFLKYALFLMCTDSSALVEYSTNFFNMHSSNLCQQVFWAAYWRHSHVRQPEWQTCSHPQAPPHNDTTYVLQFQVLVVFFVKFSQLRGLRSSAHYDHGMLHTPWSPFVSGMSSKALNLHTQAR
jgi:hypothetical protein